MKTKLDAHPSVVVVHNLETHKFLFSVYDNGYPKKAYRLSANLIGGNPESHDTSPETTLIREICEEIDPNHLEEKKFVGKVKWANNETIRRVRNGIFADFIPFQDFLVTQDGVIEGGNKPYTAIYSAFYSGIDSNALVHIENAITRDLTMTTEGSLRVCTLEDLAKSERGEFSTAHATAPILKHMFDYKIPFPKQIHAEAIGLPKKSFRDYLVDFEYIAENLKKASTAEL